VRGRIRRFARLFLGLATVIAAVGCARVNGELHVRSSRGGNLDLVARKCITTSPGDSDALCMFTVVGANGQRACVNARRSWKSGWLVVVESLSDIRAQPLFFEGNTCTALNVEVDDTPNGYTGHMQFDCTLLNGDHAAGDLTFSMCGGARG
jgi:hypothetical protein